MKKEIKIRFKSKERKMLKVMNKTVTIFELSAKFQVEPQTIERWIRGENCPSYSTKLMIATMYEEYKEYKG